MRIAFLTEGTLAPSSRFRVLQLVPALRAAGIECTVHPGYGDAYNWISETRWSSAYKLAARSRRLIAGLLEREADVLFVQRPILPFSAAPERLLHLVHPTLVFDVDDAVFVGPRGEDVPRRRRAFDRIVDASRHVIAGNRFLAEQVGAPDRTTVIPTVIDTDRYVPRTTERCRDTVVIGWMGSATTLWHLEEILPVVREIRDRYASVQVRIVGSVPPANIGREERFDFVPWSADREIPLLQSFDIGLMPLADSRVSLGKCGFKMIQYMAIGIPVVVSPVGANVDIFSGSGAGFMANGPAQWRDAIAALVENVDLRRECGNRARAHAETNYSIRAVLPRYLQVFNALTR